MSTQLILKKVYDGIWVSTDGNDILYRKILEKCHVMKDMLRASWDNFIAERSFYFGVENIEQQCIQIKANLMTTEELLNVIINTLTSSKFIPRRLLVNGLIQVCDNLGITFYVVLMSLVEDFIKGNLYVSSLTSSGDSVIFRNTTNSTIQFKISKEQYINLLQESRVF